MIVLVESSLDVNVLDSHLFAKILLPQLGAILLLCALNFAQIYRKINDCIT